MSLNKINRVRVVKYLYNAKSGEMDRYTKIYNWYRDKIYDWYQDLINYYAVKYEAKTETYRVTVSSPIRREYILQNRRGWEF